MCTSILKQTENAGLVASAEDVVAEHANGRSSGDTAWACLANDRLPCRVGSIIYESEAVRYVPALLMVASFCLKALRLYRVSQHASSVSGFVV